MNNFFCFFISFLLVSSSLLPCVLLLALLCHCVVPGQSLSTLNNAHVNANVNANLNANLNGSSDASKRSPLTLTLPNSRGRSSASPTPSSPSSLTLKPMLGVNAQYRAPSDGFTLINDTFIDSIIRVPSSSLSSLSSQQKEDTVQKRTNFNPKANVHILRSSSKIWGQWSPQKAIQAAENKHDTTNTNTNTNNDNGSNWSTGRHHLYPTTDQPADKLPEGMGDAAIYLSTHVILPSIAYAFNTPLQYLHFKDMFIAKYEYRPTTSDGRQGQGQGQDEIVQAGLGKHTDGSEYSFNMLLSNPNIDFEGGGTWIESVDLVQPNIGDVLIHRGSMLHEGCPVTKGIRYVLVGFVQSDANDYANDNINDDTYGGSNNNLKPNPNANGESQLILKTVESFPLGMVVEVDEGDDIYCATIAHVSKGGGADIAGIQKGDCIRGILLQDDNDIYDGNEEEFITFDGKVFDQVMDILVSRKGFGPVQMIVERWCSE